MKIPKFISFKGERMKDMSRNMSSYDDPVDYVFPVKQVSFLREGRDGCTITIQKSNEEIGVLFKISKEEWERLVNLLTNGQCSVSIRSLNGQIDKLKEEIEFLKSQLPISSIAELEL